MLRQILAAIGLLTILGSLLLPPTQAIHIALIGIGSILLSIQMELQFANLEDE